MKNLFYFINAVLISVIFYACADESPIRIDIQDGEFVSGEIYAKNKESVLKPISIADVSEFWIEKNELEKGTEFVDFKFNKGEPTEMDTDYYMLKAITSDGKISISSKIKNKNGVYMLTEETCKCESECSTGCEVWTMCNCTACSFNDGKCKKTHTVTSSEDEIGN